MGAGRGGDMTELWKLNDHYLLEIRLKTEPDLNQKEEWGTVTAVLAKDDEGTM